MFQQLCQVAIARRRGVGTAQRVAPNDQVWCTERRSGVPLWVKRNKRREQRNYAFAMPK